MSFKDDIELLAKSNEFKNKNKKLIENLMKGVTGDLFAAKDALQYIISSPFFIREILFWDKFEMFTTGVFANDEDIRKLSEIFADNEDKEDYAKRIIKILDDIDINKKVKYLINLTRSLLDNFIEKSDYYRLCNALINTLDEDLQYINMNINTHNLKENLYINFLQQSGLVKQTVISSNDNEFEFTRLAQLLDKYGLDFGNDLKYKYSSDLYDNLSEFKDFKTNNHIIVDGGQW